MAETPGILITVAAFVLVLGPLVFLHEYGHYIVGRWCGVKAETFSIGFGREILGWTDRRGTRWKIGWLQLGGYVQFAGDMSPASEPDAAWRSLPEAERRQTFPAQPVWKRAAIVAAGPVTNFLVAIIVIAGLGMVEGRPIAPPVAETVVAGSAAARAGIIPGDRIVAIDGTPIEQFADAQMAIFYRPGERIAMRMARDGAERDIVIVPDVQLETDRFGNSYRVGRIGVGQSRVEFVPIGLDQAPGYAVTRTGEILSLTVKTLGQVISGRRSVAELGGPLKIAKVSGEQVSLGVAAFFALVALISINLGFINLLPIPMLDGGHLMFYAIEAARRRPPSRRAQDWAFRGGFAFVVALMLLVTFNDLGSFGLWRALGAAGG